MLGWINQILLSEVLGVPSTIEGGEGELDLSYSFYDSESRFKYPPLAYSEALETLVEADNVDGDCSKTEKPCAHIMPSIWSGGKQDAAQYQGEYVLSRKCLRLYLSVIENTEKMHHKCNRKS